MSSRSDLVIHEHQLDNGETVYTLDPEVFAFRRELERQLGRKPTLEETAAAWKAQPRGERT